jgi:hypothetical protein
VQNESLGQRPGTESDAALAPVLSIVRGNPTHAEIAAVVTVLAARQRAWATLAARSTPAGRGRNGWSDRTRLLRQPIVPGRGGWRRGTAPR